MSKSSTSLPYPAPPQRPGDFIRNLIANGGVKSDIVNDLRNSLNLTQKKVEELFDKVRQDSLHDAEGARFRIVCIVEVVLRRLSDASSDLSTKEGRENVDRLAKWLDIYMRVAAGESVTKDYTKRSKRAGVNPAMASWNGFAVEGNNSSLQESLDESDEDAPPDWSTPDVDETEST